MSTAIAEATELLAELRQWVDLWGQVIDLFERARATGDAALLALSEELLAKARRLLAAELAATGVRMEKP